MIQILRFYHYLKLLLVAYFINSDKGYSKISTTEETFTIWRKISDLEDALASAKQFLCIQKLYIVNLDFANTVEGNHIKMKASIESIPI